MQRVVAAAYLAEGKSIIHDADPSDDSQAALKIIEDMGATVEKGDVIEIESSGIGVESTKLNCGESGLGLRMFSPIASLSEKEVTFDGNGTLKNRPIDFMEEVFPRVDVECSTKNGRIPMKIKGPLKGGKFSFDGTHTSQFLTGLLMALPKAKEDSIVIVNNLRSKGYVDLTLEVLRDFGVKVSNERYQLFRIEGGQSYRAKEVHIEGDWSGGAFLLVAGAIAGRVKVKGLTIQSCQPDHAVIEVLEKAGADILFSMSSIVSEKNQLKAFEFDATNCPDLFPPLAALAANCKGTSYIKGTHRLEFKESNRTQTIMEALKKVGIFSKENNDRLIINGGPISSGTIDSKGDHRIAMMAAILGLNSEGSVKIKNAECVSKSYPAFFDDLASLGAKIS
ncbi:MAG: 3-phosphoshikimate 1-carboxyvinyltransferase [Flavobacteriales bacterium]|nr:3-phosphoshikimate 1-carboxyvinyltransferase [Flavobacteriales bacterium]